MIRKYRNRLIRRWKAETPKRWQKVKGLSSKTAIVLPSAWGLVTATGIEMPTVVSYSIGSIILLCGMITGYAGLQVDKNNINNNKKQ